MRCDSPAPTRTHGNRADIYGKKSKFSLKLGQARGAAIVAASQCGLPLSEYSAKQVKKAVVGYGAAAKAQMQVMVRSLLGLKTPLQEDEADALAVAICHAHSGPLAVLKKV